MTATGSSGTSASTHSALSLPAASERAASPPPQTRKALRERDNRPIRRTATIRPIEDVWDASTDPERLKRWLSTVSGDLRVGETVDVGGFGSADVRRCEPLHLLRVTWGAANLPVGEVELRLSLGENNSTMLDLEHATVSQTIEWDKHFVDALSLTGTGREPASRRSR